MRIAIVTESFLPTINGVTNSVLRILEHLGDQGHTATVIAPENSHGPTQYQGHSIARVPALPLQSISKVGLPLGIPSRRLETAITRFNPDLVQLASPFILGGAAALSLGLPDRSGRVCKTLRALCRGKWITKASRKDSPKLRSNPCSFIFGDV